MTAIFRHIVITFIFLIIIIDMVGLEDAIEIISTLENAGIKVFIDGGWGVDALLGYQSRAHNDIDIFIESSHKDNTFKILSINGYKEIKMDYSNTDHSVWKDKKIGSSIYIYFHIVPISIIYLKVRNTRVRFSPELEKSGI